MEELKKLEIKNLLLSLWDSKDKAELCQDIMNGYIFGGYASNEHYNIDDITAIYDEIYLEKNPLPVMEEVVNNL